MSLVIKYDMDGKCHEYYSLQRFYQYWNNDYINFQFKYVNKYDNNGYQTETDAYENNRLFEIRTNVYDIKRNLISYQKKSPRGKIFSDNLLEYNSDGFVSKLTVTMYPSRTNKFLETFQKVYFYGQNNLPDYTLHYKEGNLKYKVVYKYEFYDGSNELLESYNDKELIFNDYLVSIQPGDIEIPSYYILIKNRDNLETLYNSGYTFYHTPGKLFLSDLNNDGNTELVVYGPSGKLKGLDKIVMFDFSKKLSPIAILLSLDFNPNKDIFNSNGKMGIQIKYQKYDFGSGKAETPIKNYTAYYENGSILGPNDKEFLEVWKDFKKAIKNKDKTKISELTQIPYKGYWGWEGGWEISSHNTKESLIIAYDSIFTNDECLDLAEFNNEITYIKDDIIHIVTLCKNDNSDYEYRILFGNKEGFGGSFSYIFSFVDNKFKLVKYYAGD